MSKEEIKETAAGELEQGEFKVKKKPGRPKKLTKKDEPIKVKLEKKEDAVQEPKTTKVVLQSEEKKEEQNVELQEVGSTHKEEPEVIQVNAPKDPIPTKLADLPPASKKDSNTKRIVELPEDLKKVVDFMQDTGGNLQDYVRLNKDYSNVDEKTLLREYYKSTKPHLNHEEVEFIMEDNFSYDEEVDEERDVKKKKLAMKEEIAKAKNFLEETKTKYYEEIKLRPSISQEQQKAMDFFNRYSEQQQQLKEQKEKFTDNTKDYFSKDFKGFEFNLGDKKFNYNVNNVDEIAEKQSELTTLVKKFLNDEGEITDHKGYHKALYAAQNADTIAQHFYEQGKADGIKNMVNKSKNIETASRPQNNGEIFVNGLKVKAINGVDSSKLKIQKRK